jgi:hypothetical protein
LTLKLANTADKNDADEGSVLLMNKGPTLGKLPPKYSFVLNPYPDERLSRCPFCGQKTGQRKLPLFIHVDPMYPIVLNYTCRYCQDCNLLIAHKHEIEHLLTEMFKHYDRNALGNDYLSSGTVDKKVWREGLNQPKAIDDMLQHTSDFATYYQELRVRQSGWYREGEEAPVREPPPSQEWIRR